MDMSIFNPSTLPFMNLRFSVFDTWYLSVSLTNASMDFLSDFC